MEGLPSHLWVHLVGNTLSIRDVLNFASTCKHWHTRFLGRESLEANSIWKVYFHRNVSSVNRPPEGQTYLEAMVRQSSRLSSRDVRVAFRDIGLYGYDKAFRRVIVSPYIDTFTLNVIEQIISGIMQRENIEMFELLVSLFLEDNHRHNCYSILGNYATYEGSCRILSIIIQQSKPDERILNGWFYNGIIHKRDPICDLILMEMTKDSTFDYNHILRCTISHN